jgi:hypothetical protein
VVDLLGPLAFPLWCLGDEIGFPSPNPACVGDQLFCFNGGQSYGIASAGLSERCGPPCDIPELGKLWIMVWLLTKGAKVQPLEDPA